MSHRLVSRTHMRCIFKDRIWMNGSSSPAYRARCPRQPMNRRSTNFFSARRGTTLVEVIAALVILGTILAAMLIARGRFVRQDVQARRRIEATRALDALVHRWMNGPVSAIPVQATGSLGDDSGQTWSTHLMRDPAAEEIGARVLHVDVFDRSERQPIVALDLLIHPEQSNGT